MGAKIARTKRFNSQVLPPFSIIRRVDDIGASATCKHLIYAKKQKIGTRPINKNGGSMFINEDFFIREILECLEKMRTVRLQKTSGGNKVPKEGTKKYQFGWIKY
jgi:ribosomal protein S19E (S16A)